MTQQTEIKKLKIDLNQKDFKHGSPKRGIQLCGQFNSVIILFNSSMKCHQNNKKVKNKLGKISL